MQGGSSNNERFIGPDGRVKTKYGGPPEEPVRRERQEKKKKPIRGKVVSVSEVGSKKKRGGLPDMTPANTGCTTPQENSKFGYLAQQFLERQTGTRKKR